MKNAHIDTQFLDQELSTYVNFKHIVQRNYMYLNVYAKALLNYAMHISSRYTQFYVCYLII